MAKRSGLKRRFLRYVLKTRKRPAQNRRRVGQSLILLSVFLFCIILINFAIIIGTDSKFGHDLSEEAQARHQTEVTVQATRGTIYDRNGTPIAEDSTTYTVYAIIDDTYVSEADEPLYVQESQYDQVASIFKELLGMDKDFVKEQLSLSGFQVYFGANGKNISYSTMTTIVEAMDAAGIQGIGFDTSPGRMYPNGVFATTFIGLAQLEDNDDGSQSLVGKTGLEQSLNDILSGQDGKITYEKDSKGRIVPGTEIVETEKVDGQDVYTTLSADLQLSLETNMDVFFEETGGVYASATLMAAETGEILATTQRPTFDADTKEGLTEDFFWRSLLYQGNDEPGSTMKVMTLAAAIDEGVFDPNEYYTNNGYTIADATVNDWTVNGGRDPQTLTFAQGFALSSNVLMLTLEQRMGNETWLNYLNKFRFGDPTRFGLMNETSGVLPEDNEFSIAASSFGQGLSATQVQMLRAFSAIGNDGVMLQPKFIAALYDSNTNSARLAETEVVGNPVSANTASQTRDYMVTVGTDPVYGTLVSSTMGTVIKVDGYNIAVKSGTAQIAAEDGTGYLTGDYDTINSVVAMIPAEDPKFIMYVTVQQPTSFSLTHWADIVNPLLSSAMQLEDSLNLTESVSSLAGVTEETEYILEDIIGETPGTTAEELRRHLVQPVILGNGDEITKVSVEEGTNLAANQQILLLTSNFTTVPDMYGWTKENVETFAKWTDIEIIFDGTGTTVTDQNVDTGTSLEDTKEITITLGE